MFREDFFERHDRGGVRMNFRMFCRNFFLHLRVVAVRTPELYYSVRSFRIDRSIGVLRQDSNEIIKRNSAWHNAFVQRLKNWTFRRKRVDAGRRFKQRRVVDLAKLVGVHGRDYSRNCLRYGYGAIRQPLREVVRVFAPFKWRRDCYDALD